jgi:hypothetical protein
MTRLLPILCARFRCRDHRLCIIRHHPLFFLPILIIILIFLPLVFVHLPRLPANIAERHRILHHFTILSCILIFTGGLGSIFNFDICRSLSLHASSLSQSLNLDLRELRDHGEGGGLELEKFLWLYLVPVYH